ncbi:response regulator transcription factor [Halarcobacter bivalviorum]|uniref:DNA-binding response regulator n=1 Tax=Halarcobacter bivalviorum TaxID=663364 RepID=A0AAX2A994_9BACT|nr:response regulator transcription factor [Halarcobacter bivalviorum]AXH12676.1 two-component system response regulator [Halarcobacter bivalviorum]RXK08110.1 DNA-binding response regulator [Halarcobacter bivalviorum]RXK10400.1 DNA-binding response regulator [Halarcobacter bivalviorum]
MKVLLLEDDPALNDLLNEHLVDQGFDVTLCINGQEALEYLVDDVFDFALLDINTPILSGIDVLKTIRTDYKNQTPVIILTAFQDMKHLKESFESGVDDYIKKPFDLEELDQRIKKLCKQFNLDNNSEIKISEEMTFLPELCQLHYKGTIKHLAQKERDILSYFCKHKNRVISSEELLQNIWAYEEMPTDATIRVYIKNLREALGKDKIQTIRGIGYKFE